MFADRRDGGCSVASSSGMRRFPPKRILVAADLSAPSASALDAAKSLAEEWDSALEIVYVQPPAALLELARPERADLLVMGTHGYAGLDRLLTGSVAEAVVRRAQIPVLAVPERKEALAVARVLAPWNGHANATRALRWARELARGLRATLDVLHVQEPGLAVQQDWAMLERKLVAVLGAGPDWTLRTSKGDARARIVAEANSGRYELVVLSAHRRPFASGFVLGSTIERLLRHSEVPVVSVPSGGTRPGLARRLAARAGSGPY